ncbi:class A beta-lactamase-related serine hydrolase [Psychrobacillus glaciei]|uniref:Class A beta-lactamase-related serine hydrolase n=1 Tax=Psychrobacillus glaciei TaxID=2283160 RepID=A0A5J6SMT0_9BACI|nr:serine hydrolase domain-containing protein [Psychrobacillus glaciei]QFF99320.1 class A beta-lactamase-related serine hydrolase [Psychrobacillus glaciei]
MTIDLQIRLKEWEEAYNLNSYLFGSLLVAYKGEILLNNAYGMANLEHKVLNTSETKFRIGSITKSFTAAAIFQLQEQNKLHIQDPINKYLPDFPNGDRITIYNCLTNTSGITNFTSFSDFWDKTMRLSFSLEEVISSFKSGSLLFDPGTKFDYSNSGYLILTAIIEGISGENYAEYMEGNIFIPLGMYNTGCNNEKEIVPNLASGYTYFGKPVHATYANPSFPLGAYGLYSTVGDLYIWDRAIRANQLVSEEATKWMLQPFIDSYACGWFRDPVLEKDCYHHFGDISGFVNQMLCFLDDLTIIFLSNMDIVPVKKLTREIAKIVLNEPYDLPQHLEKVKVQSIDFISGKYVMKDCPLPLHITTEENDLFLTVSKDYGVQYKFNLIPINQEYGKIVFKTTMIDETLEISHSNNEVTSILYTDYFGKQTSLYNSKNIIKN